MALALAMIIPAGIIAVIILQIALISGKARDALPV